MGLTVLGSPSDLCACSACENLTVTLSACWLEPDGKIKRFASSHQTESACVCVCVCVLGLHNCKGSLCIHFNSFKKKKQRPKNQLKWIRLMSDFMRAQQTHLLLQSRAEVSGRWTSDRQGGAWQGDVWQSPLPHAAAVVGDLERTPLVVVLSTSCTGEESLLIIIKIHSSTEVLIPKLIKEPSPTHGLWETPPVPPALPGWDKGPPREAS